MIKQTIIFNQEESDYNSEITPNTIAQVYGYPRGEFGDYAVNEISSKRYTKEEMHQIYMGSKEGIIPVYFNIFDSDNKAVLNADAFIKTSYEDEDSPEVA